MTINDNQYYIFIQNGNQKIPVTKEELYDAFTESTWMVLVPVALPIG